MTCHHGRLGLRAAYGRSDRLGGRVPLPHPLPRRHPALDLRDGAGAADDDGASVRADGAGGGAGAASRRRWRQAASQWPGANMFGDPAKLMQAQAQLWTEGLAIWQRALGDAAGGAGAGEEERELAEKADKDRRFASAEWRDNPLYDTIRQTYLLVSDRLLGSVDALEGVDAATREKIRFNTSAFVDAMSPSQLRAHQPAGDGEGDGDAGREPAQGPGAYAGRPHQRPAQPYRHRARSRSARISRRRRARSSTRRRSSSSSSTGRRRARCSRRR